MCELATESSPLIMVEDWEATQTEYVRTLFVLQHLDNALNQQMQASPAEEARLLSTPAPTPSDVPLTDCAMCLPAGMPAAITRAFCGLLNPTHLPCAGCPFEDSVGVRG